MIKIKLSELTRKQNFINSLVDEEEVKQYDSKLKFAVQIWNERFLIINKKITEKAQKKANEQHRVINIDHAAEKEIGKLKVLARTGDAYNYTKESEKLRQAAILKINDESNKGLNEKEVNFHPFLLTDKETIDKLDRFTISQLKDIFIPAKLMPDMPFKVEAGDLDFDWDWDEEEEKNNAGDIEEKEEKADADASTEDLKAAVADQDTERVAQG